MTTGERIKRRRKELGLSADALAERLGKNRATVYRYEGNEIENMSLEVIKDIAKILKVDPAYLMGWTDSEENLHTSSKYNYYPTSISAGNPMVADPVTEYDTKKITLPDSMMGKWAGNNDIYIMRVNGESMNKTIPHGSLIAVKSIELSNLKDGDIVVYSNEHDYAVKRFYQYNDKILFRPHSTDFSFTDDQYTLSEANELRIHGKVVLYIVELD